MKPAARRAWLAQYLLSRQAAAVGYRYRVDILDAHFVNRYISETEAPYYPTILGAHRCPRLGTDLAAMYKAGDLGRCSIGVPAVTAGGGWPKWVWSYHIADPELLASQHGTTFEAIREHIRKTNTAYKFAPLDAAVK